MKLAPVLVEVNRWDISICPLAQLPDGQLAVDSAKTFRPLGSVRKVFHVNKNRIFKWEWEDADGAGGPARTKAEAITIMLQAHGFRAARLQETIPNLLDGLEN